MKTKKMKLRVAQQVVLGYLRAGIPHDHPPMVYYNMGWHAQTMNALLRKGLVTRDCNDYVLTEKGLVVSKQDWPDFVLKYVMFNDKDVLMLGKVLGETPNGEDWIVSFTWEGVEFKGLWRKASCER